MNYPIIRSMTVIVNFMDAILFTPLIIISFYIDQVQCLVLQILQNLPDIKEGDDVSPWPIIFFRNVNTIHL